MKNKIITFSFVGYIILMAILHILFQDNEISNTERRKLASFPDFEFSSEYITKVEKYLLDHFPYRDDYRSIKASFNYDILGRLDNNGIYIKDNYIFKSNYPTDKDSVSNFITKTNKLKDMLTSNNKTYLMIVPDKNYYLKDNNFLHLDYDYIYNEIDKLNITNIDIRNIMNLNDYYETDTHWRQENLGKVVYEMSKIMNFNYTEEYSKKNEYDSFYGVYYGESAVNRSPEKLIYLTNKTINNASVKYLENSKLDNIYNLDKLTSLDSYEVYLDGASSFIEIVNNNSDNDKELVIFRDSFGSSITPLLINYYSKITVIDNRYINSYNISNLISFDNQDVLFLYSTLIVNTSNTLKG